MRTVSEAEFPISTTITGALLIIEPGALRELIGTRTRPSGNFI